MTRLRLRSDRLHWLEAHDEIVALDERELVYLSTNAAGALLWQMLARDATRDELVHCVLVEFDIDQETAETDVDSFVAALEARGLLERTDA